jgi:uridine phosphorylase
MFDDLIYSAADLPVTREGRIYHLNLLPSELALNILLVGDPERVPFIAMNHLSEIEADIQHRGLRTITGIAKETGMRVSIVASGMGTSSLEIVLQELLILNEINLTTRKRKLNYTPLHLIRVGTSGSLQSDTILGTLIISDYAIGMDNTGLFYEVSAPDEDCLRLERKVKEAIAINTPLASRFFGKIHPYASKANIEVVNALTKAATSLSLDYRVGITVSNSGFFANQGRDIGRVAPSIKEIDSIFTQLDSGIPNHRFENMEMEASFLLHLANGSGCKAGVICSAIANRQDRTFLDNYESSIDKAIKVALLALHTLDCAEIY